MASSAEASIQLFCYFWIVCNMFKKIGKPRGSSLCLPMGINLLYHDHEGYMRYIPSRNIPRGHGITYTYASMIILNPLACHIGCDIVSLECDTIDLGILLQTACP